MSESKVNSCVFQRGVVAGRFQPDPQRKCSCRKIISQAKANELVSGGAANWVVLAREKKGQERPCRVCEGGDFKTSCNACAKTGKMYVKLPDVLSQRDIVLTTHSTKTNRNSTPRVPTIEEGHIERAYLSEDNDGIYAQERISEYGAMIALSLMEQGAAVHVRITGKEYGRLSNGQRMIYPGKPEPVGGREKDWGRAI